MRPLFIAGCPRSGTTALTEYLNEHEEILVCNERYKYSPHPRDINISLFTFDRILDYREVETNIPREWHENLLRRKDPSKLKWVGDKRGMYVKWFELLAKNNPGARFMVIHRPIEEVAESFQARNDDPRDIWRGDYREAVERWNLAVRRTREFVEKEQDRVLILHYHDFFYRNETCVPLVSEFLEIEFGEAVLATWRAMSSQFEAERRDKEMFGEEQTSYIQENKDQESEEWLLGRIEEQRKEILGTSLSSAGQVQRLEQRLAFERREAQQLREQNRRLMLRLQNIQNSRSWRLVESLQRIRTRVLGGKKSP